MIAKFSCNFSRFRKFSDAFGPVRMRSDVIGCNRMYFGALGRHFWKFSGFSDFFGRFGDFCSVFGLGGLQRCVESSSKTDARNFSTFPEIWATPSPVESCIFSGCLAKGGCSVIKSIIIYRWSLIIPIFVDALSQPSGTPLLYIDHSCHDF